MLMLQSVLRNSNLHKIPSETLLKGLNIHSGDETIRDGSLDKQSFEFKAFFIMTFM